MKITQRVSDNTADKLEEGVLADGIRIPDLIEKMLKKVKDGCQLLLTNFLAVFDRHM